MEGTGVIQVEGSRHETVGGAREVVQRYGYDLSQFPMILAGLRNPYHMEVSRYTYLQKGNPWDRGYNQDLALNDDFETFAIKSTDHGGRARPIQSYFLVDGRRPERLEIVKAEALEQQVRAVLQQIGLSSDFQFPHLNSSLHEDYRAYYTEKAEEAVYQRYRWVFENGFYERMNAGTVAQVKVRNRYQPSISGPVRQVGGSSGFWPDKWVGSTFEILVRIVEPVSEIAIEGWLPDRLGSACPLTVNVDDRRIESCFEAGRRFTWLIPGELTPGTKVAVRIASPETWCPKEEGNSLDGRKLSFQLDRICFK
jgi:hypothetical protein